MMNKVIVWHHLAPFSNVLSMLYLLCTEKQQWYVNFTAVTQSSKLRERSGLFCTLKQAETQKDIIKRSFKKSSQKSISCQCACVHVWKYVYEYIGVLLLLHIKSNLQPRLFFIFSLLPLLSITALGVQGKIYY